MPDKETPEGQGTEGTAQDATPQEPTAEPVDYYTQYKQHGIDLKEIKPEHLKEAWAMRQYMGDNDPRAFFAEVGRENLSWLLETDPQYRQRFMNDYLLKQEWAKEHFGPKEKQVEEEEQDPERAALLQEARRLAVQDMEEKYGAEFTRMRNDMVAQQKAAEERELKEVIKGWEQQMPDIMRKLSVPSTGRTRDWLWHKTIDGIYNEVLDGSTPEKFEASVKSVYEDFQRAQAELRPARGGSFLKPGPQIPKSVNAETKESFDDLIADATSKLEAYTRGETIE